MDILRYNRRLVWVVVPLVLWALVGIALAIGAGSRGLDRPPLEIRVGLPEGGLWIPGRLLSVTETTEGLKLRIGVRPGDNPPIDHQHDNLEIELVETTGPSPGPPQVQVLNEEVHLAGNDRGAALGENFLLKFDRWHVQVIPRGPEMTVERFQDGIRQYFRGEGRGRPQGPRGRGQPGGDQPPPPPGPGQESRQQDRGPNPRRPQ